MGYPWETQIQFLFDGSPAKPLIGKCNEVVDEARKIDGTLSAAEVKALVNKLYELINEVSRGHHRRDWFATEVYGSLLGRWEHSYDGQITAWVKYIDQCLRSGIPEADMVDAQLKLEALKEERQALVERVQQAQHEIPTLKAREEEMKAEVEKLLSVLHRLQVDEKNRADPKRMQALAELEQRRKKL